MCVVLSSSSMSANSLHCSDLSVSFLAPDRLSLSLSLHSTPSELSRFVLLSFPLLFDLYTLQKMLNPLFFYYVLWPWPSPCFLVHAVRSRLLVKMVYGLTFFEAMPSVRRHD